MFLTYTDMVHSTRVVLPHLSLYKEQSFRIPAFILPCKPSFFCLLPAQAVHASSNTSGPLLNHYNSTSFILKDINQAWAQDMKCDLLSASQFMTLILCFMYPVWLSQKLRVAGGSLHILTPYCTLISVKLSRRKFLLLVSVHVNFHFSHYFFPDVAVSASSQQILLQGICLLHVSVLTFVCQWKHWKVSHKKVALKSQNVMWLSSLQPTHHIPQNSCAYPHHFHLTSNFSRNTLSNLLKKSRQIKSVTFSCLENKLSYQRKLSD